ncbi:MAG: hypothetical protein AB7L66_11825 [Gemmatimonadales bacterium]
MTLEWKSPAEKRQGWLAVLCLGALACGSADAGRPAPASPAVTQPPFTPQLVSADPCGWLPPARVSELLGRRLRGVPVRVASAESVTPSSSGAGCMYELDPEPGREPGMVSVEVKVDGAEMEAGLGAASLGAFGSSRGEWTADWDWVSGLPAGLFAARRGHLGILIAINDVSLAPAAAEPLAAGILAAVPDQPFAVAAADASVAGAAPDPCGLVTRAEAEAVLGPLAVAPYRSRESTALVYGDGASCTYYSSGHRVVVLTPTWRDGRMVFGLSRGIGGLTRIVTGDSGAGAAAGPWDDHADGIAGTRYFLAGDRLLAIQRAGPRNGDAATLALARLAVPRLAQ